MSTLRNEVRDFIKGKEGEEGFQKSLEAVIDISASKGEKFEYNFQLERFMINRNGRYSEVKFKSGSVFTKSGREMLAFDDTRQKRLQCLNILQNALILAEKTKTDFPIAAKLQAATLLLSDAEGWKWEKKFEKLRDISKRFQAGEITLECAGKQIKVTDSFEQIKKDLDLKTKQEWTREYQVIQAAQAVQAVQAAAPQVTQERPELRAADERVTQGLRDANNRLTRENQDLLARNERLGQENQSLRRDLRARDQAIQERDQTIAELKKDVADLKIVVKTLVEEVNDLKQAGKVSLGVDPSWHGSENKAGPSTSSSSGRTGSELNQSNTGDEAGPSTRRASTLNRSGSIAQRQEALKAKVAAAPNKDKARETELDKIRAAASSSSAKMTPGLKLWVSGDSSPSSSGASSPNLSEHDFAGKNIAGSPPLKKKL